MLLEARLLDERREGKAEGRVEGKAEEKNAIAKLMLAKGCYSLQEISELTKLSIKIRKRNARNRAILTKHLCTKKHRKLPQ